MSASQPPEPLQVPHLSRRGLLIGGALGLSLASAPLRAQAARGFTHGVASGEPGPGSVLLWTRFVGPGATRLRYELSESADFAKVASGGMARAAAGSDWCAKATARGLKPATWYHYRFIAPNGSMSAVGRTRTLPDGQTDRFRMAVFSCSNLGFGYFNAYAHAAAEGAFDLAVHLGDYLYEYNSANYPDPRQRVDGRVPAPQNELIQLADYRLRYASYRSDPDLLRLHQLYPMISVFDDHESANDAWKGGAENHTPGTEGPWSARSRAAMRARREWLPISDEPWARYDIGDLATLFRLETRLTARDKPLDVAALMQGVAPAQIDAALIALRDGAYANPKRTLMGSAQERWLAQGLASSVRSGRKWQVLAQQIVMGSLHLPGDLAERLPKDAPDYVRKRIAASATAARAGLPFNMDAWDGYPAARTRLLNSAREADANLVVLSGDSHNAWACELGGAGVEFAGSSVTSPGAEAYLPFLKGTELARSLVRASPDLKWAETAQRGYLAIELTPQRASGEFRFTEGVRRRSDKLADVKRLAADYGARRFTQGLSA